MTTEKKREYNKKYYLENKDKAKEYHKEYRLKNKEKIKEYRKEYCKKYYSENKEKIREKNKRFYLENKEKIKNWRSENKEERKEWQARYRAENLDKVRQRERQRAQRRLESSPKHRIHASFRAGMHRSIKDKRKSKSFDLVGYSREDLIIHLEKKFAPGMSWENYGKWHIDHIRPLSWFNLESKHDAEFKVCWALDNLQPLWASDNIKKGNRFEG